MTPKTTNRTRNIWADAVVVLNTTARTDRPAPTEQPVPAARPATEEEADRWVAQMMFEDYNQRIADCRLLIAD